jgi:hypothetical protein
VVDGKGYHVTYYATFHDGKLVRHWREADAMPAPRSGGGFNVGATRGLH